MPVRPGRCYRHFSGPPYTRLEYIHGAPMVQIPKFDMGTTSGADRARFNIAVKLVAREQGHIRAQSLEAARQISYKYLSRKIGDNNFYLRINIYPHHVLRENKMLAMAGADRLQEGMRLAFGSPAGRAARVHQGTVIIYVESTAQYVEAVKEALRRAASKISLPTRIMVMQKEGANGVSDSSQGKD